MLIKAKDFWKVNKQSWYGVLCLCASVKNNSISSGNEPSLTKVWAIFNFGLIGPPSRNGMRVCVCLVWCMCVCVCIVCGVVHVYVCALCVYGACVSGVCVCTE